MKWGVLGGTFDPIHTGHLRCAEEVREQFGLDRILFIPAGRPPHKPDDAMTPFVHREQMVRVAVEGREDFRVEDIENRREGCSYSVDTVGYLRAAGPPDLEIFFILGQDAFRALTTWKDWERLLGLCHFVVMTRPGYESWGLAGALPDPVVAAYAYDKKLDAYVGSSGTRLYFREVTFLDIASSDIRRRVAEKRSIRYLVPEGVRRYIEAQGLYGAAKI